MARYRYSDAHGRFILVDVPGSKLVLPELIVLREGDEDFTFMNRGVVGEDLDPFTPIEPMAQCRVCSEEIFFSSVAGRSIPFDVQPSDADGQYRISSVSVSRVGRQVGVEYVPVARRSYYDGEKLYRQHRCRER